MDYLGQYFKVDVYLIDRKEGRVAFKFWQLPFRERFTDETMEKYLKAHKTFVKDYSRSEEHTDENLLVNHAQRIGATLAYVIANAYQRNYIN